MLTLRDIRKEYNMGESVVHALRGVSIGFRDNEFVAVLGPSGCGKTTLLNIIGGLDGYTSGDLVIDGTSTRRFRDAQWDAYRNHSVGFVFQSYNLIPHQSVLANVELALKLSHDLSAGERRRRAMAALDKVGLADQAGKKPSMMSGGQMQRVAIARALVNDPAIILADEPTGALDSETSVQVMDILREVARDRLVIMVTHNPELAEQYATRIVRLKDGQVVSDTMPLTAAELSDGTGKLPRRTRLGLGTALGLSLQNLLTKKGRTLLTAFAGAIGIIGIALILALSNGVNDYIQGVEEDTMGNYPIELERETFSMDLSANAPVLTGNASEDAAALDAVYSQNVIADSVHQSTSMMVENDLAAFKAYLDERGGEMGDAVAAIEYGYAITPQAYRLEDGEAFKVSPSTLLEDAGVSTTSFGGMPGGMSMGSSNSTAWQQFPSDQGLRERGYTVLAGHLPEGANEAVLVVNESNQVSDYVLYTLGLMDLEHFDEVVSAAKEGLEVDDPQARIDYGDVLGRTYSVLAPTQLYERNEDGVWIDMSDDEEYLREAIDQGIEVTIVGVVRAEEDAQLSSGVAYDARLTSALMDVVAQSDILAEQLANPSTNVLTGEPFEKDDDEEEEKEEEEGGTIQEVSAYHDDAEPQAILAAVYSPSEDMVTDGLAEITTPSTSDAVETPQVVGDVEPPEDAALFLGEQGDGSLENDDAAADEIQDGPAGEDGPDDPNGPDDPDEPDDPTPTGFSVRFLNYDGSVLSSGEGYGDGATVDCLPAGDPTRPDDATSRYLFIGWVSSTDDPTTDGRYYVTRDIPAVTGRADYVALYYGMPLATNPSTPDQSGSANVPGGTGMPNGEGVPATGTKDSPSVTPDMDALSGLSGMNASNLSGIDLSQYMSGLPSSGSAASGIDMSALSGMDVTGMDVSGVDLSAIEGSALGEGLSEGQLQAILQGMSSSTPSTYADVLEALGYATTDQPSSIAIYPADFEGKSVVEDFIASYNSQAADDEQVTYTDIVGTMIGAVTSIVDTISYVLIAFVAISLVVSSIMIAIITYISVLERTKEIGVLRALGASKGDVSKIFNAETLIEGLLAGLMGVGATLAICVPVNAVVEGALGVSGIAHLPTAAGLALIGVSIALTLLAGFIPSRVAARKDPAVALRSE